MGDIGTSGWHPRRWQRCLTVSWPSRSKIGLATNLFRGKPENLVTHGSATIIWRVVSAWISPIFSMTANTSSSTMKLPRSHLMGFDFLRISGLTYLRERSVAISAARASIGLSEDRTLVALSVPLLQSGYSTCTG